MTDFTTSYVLEGYGRISATYSDFHNSVNFINSLDLDDLRAAGPQYLQTVQLENIRNRMYEYPDDSKTLKTEYDLFG